MGPMRDQRVCLRIKQSGAFLSTGALRYFIILLLLEDNFLTNHMVSCAYFAPVIYTNMKKFIMCSVDRTSFVKF